MSYRYSQLGRTPEIGSPFICQTVPFVCSNSPAVYPFVGKKAPFVWNGGFTITELIITLTIAGILMAVAAPNMFTFVASNRLASQINELTADISLARSEAIKRNTTSGVCVSTTGTTCAAAGNWADGWMVFVMEGAVTTVIRSREKLSGKNTLVASADTLSFTRNGFQPAGSANFVFTLCDPKLNQFRTVTVVPTGRPGLTQGTPC